MLFFCLSTFQSTPAITGERAHPRRFTRTQSKTFQSTPAITGERAMPDWVFILTVTCFNPRPPLLASEPPGQLQAGLSYAVSIHARHYWRASPTLLQTNNHKSLVSIHARHYWRASPAPQADADAARRVSIHASHYWRASRARALDGTPAQRVSIHARHYWRASRPALARSI